MPQIVIKGMAEKTVEKISGDICKELAVIMESPKDWFSVEYLPIKFYVCGKATDHYPMVEVIWFDRGQEVKDLAAKAIDKIIRQEGFEQIEIFFTPLEKNSYYENGEHY